MRRLAALAALALLVAGAALGWAWMRPVPEDAPTVTVEIPAGAGLAAAGQRLEDAGLVASGRAWALAARVLGGDRPVQRGTYALRRGAGWGVLLDMFQDGRVVLRFLTIPEGWPSVLVHDRLMAAPDLSGAVPVPPEGSLLPATYDYAPGTERAALVARMQKGMEASLDALWPTKTAASVVKTRAEAVNLAAIVEKETAVASERRRIAGVYSNRLRIGMKLDADPTVIYPITKGRPLGRRIRQSELRRDTGYNTYLKPGLPAGPIANPGRDSIAAVLDPEPHAFLYFVADGRGGHVFAKTYAEHQANVRKWFAIRRERGEM
jgi:UPF0755 protein